VTNFFFLSLVLEYRHDKLVIVVDVDIIIIIKSFYSLWSVGHPRRASSHCGLQLSPWPRSMIFLCFLSRPLLSFATFSLACLSFCIPENSNLMRFSVLLLFLYVMCVQSNSIFCFLSDYNWINQLSNTTIWWLDICCLLLVSTTCFGSYGHLQVDILTTNL